jgi:hypothetical protein
MPLDRSDANPTDDADAHPNDATPLTLNTRASSPEGRALIEEICGRVSRAVASPSGYRRGLKRTAALNLAVEALVAGVLLNAARHGQREWSYQPLSSPAFTGEAVGQRLFDIAWRALEADGLVERLPSFTRFHGAPGELMGRERKATRFRPAPGLYALCAAHGVVIPTPPEATWTDHFRRHRPAGPHEPLRLRALSTIVKRKRIDGARLDPHDGLWSTGFAREVADANVFITKFDISGCDPILFHRTFTHDLEHGGRWYASYSSTKAVDRRRIRINGAAVIEVDVHASHLTILHGLDNRNLPERHDLYGDLGFPREVVKRWMTATFGAGQPVLQWSPRMHTEALSKGIALANYRPGAVAAAAFDAYPVLGNMLEVCGCVSEPRLCSSALMWWEARALTEAMTALSKQGVPALPLHDALIVREGDREAALAALIRGYEIAVGVTPRVR